MIGKELYQSRNMKQPFAKGFFVGGAIANAMVVSKGRFPGGRWPNHRDADSPMTIDGKRDEYPKPDGKYIFDKLSSVYVSGQRHPRRRAQPHPRPQERPARDRRDVGCRCARPGCTRSPMTRPANGPVDVIVNYTNCVQCGAITAKGGRLTPPEGGDGPLYTVT